MATHYPITARQKANKRSKLTKALAMLKALKVTAAEVYAADYWRGLEAHAKAVTVNATPDDGTLTATGLYECMGDDGDLLIEDDVRDAIAELFYDDSDQPQH